MDALEDMEDMLPSDAHMRQASSGVTCPAKACAAAPELGSVWVKTFGCSHNVSDGEYMAGLLSSYGYR